ncbi:hypothetical protein THAOC_00010 [Thalassiosira oceanica]|uniref:Uncharacterized protein n=1 Tax=Thalassiosira oceanica TaxID=159749 RepID=K0THA0_THAOC|nr:hypothetical protein THAOC_00010 [Thalassiosira oceanica]|eukprot:EJK78108.1 hypothetical protein THAOC_00010 [Thalassiosira oceanica]
MADHVREWNAVLPSTGGKAGRTSTCEEEDAVTRAPVSQAASVMDQDGAANISSSVDKLPSPGDEAGSKSACEEDDDWVIVEYHDFPALPTYPGGATDFSRLELEHVHLVPIEDWILPPFSWKYYGFSGDGNDAAHETNIIARRSLLFRHLKRQLKADRILTRFNYDFTSLRLAAELDCECISDDDKREARARGFTRAWKLDWKHYEYRRYYLCDSDE